MDRPTLLQQLPSALLGGGSSLRASDRRLAWTDSGVVLAVGLMLHSLGQVGTVRGLHPFGLGADDLSAWWHLVPLVVAAAALVLKRRKPLLVMAAVAVCFAGDLLIGGSVAMVVMLWDALYATHLHGSVITRRVTGAGIVAVIAAAVISSAAATSDPRVPATLAFALVALVVTPMWWGSNVRHNSELADAADERARLERERSSAMLRLAEAERHDAVRAERSAVARDLHDVVASHLSAIALTSGAALAGDDDADRTRAALRSVRAESLASLDDMRAMIRVLRSDPVDAHGDAGDLTAASRTANLGPVLEQTRLAGMPVRVEDPAGLVDGADLALPVAVDHAVYRIVRESLTNAVKHGGGTAYVRLVPGEVLEVEVSDEGGDRETTEAGSATGVGTGTGLVSMRERAEALDGTFEAGPDGPGWRVRTVLPLRASSEVEGGTVR
ncbi:signal transduction histidine kinase [Nocardioides albertanoniae]|uniref:histidine kinase n=1 Tax=Nocardioides albertanoniae TaxID=1175486 RepID=A0A543A5G6_9ACTN|nr:histidine kinase [Nocardioides albertanoniae]TQL67794.1 signal transduction histidine kinase [Nocardioides albertanoniae]